MTLALSFEGFFLYTMHFNSVNRKFSSKEFTYLKKQDKLFFFKTFDTIPVRFVNKSESVINEFGSQPKIVLHLPTFIPVYFRNDSLKKIMDRFNLEETPEAVATFSVAVLEEIGAEEKGFQVTEDMQLFFHGIEWRVSTVFKDDFVGSDTDRYLHYHCLLERNTRTEVLKEEQKYFVDLNFFANRGVGLSDYELIRSDTVDITKIITFNPTNEQIYLMYLDEFPDLDSIMDTSTNTNILSDFTKTVISVDGVNYKFYESNNTYNQQLLLKFNITYSS